MARWAGPDAPVSRNALESACGSRSRSRGGSSLRGEPFEAPTAPLPGDVAQPVVEAVVAVFPELDPSRFDRITPPGARQRHLVGMGRGQLQHLLLEHLARAHDAALR